MKQLAIKTQLDGYKFDSKKEAQRYAELKLLLIAGEIRDLRIHPKLPLFVNGVFVCDYHPDFIYRDVKTGQQIAEDVKSEWTRKLPVFRLKWKMAKALYDFDFREV